MGEIGGDGAAGYGSFGVMELWGWGSGGFGGDGAVRYSSFGVMELWGGELGGCLGEIGGG